MTEKYAELVLQKTSIACYFIKVQFIKARGGGGGGVNVIFSVFTYVTELLKTNK